MRHAAPSIFLPDIGWRLSESNSAKLLAVSAPTTFGPPTPPTRKWNSLYLEFPGPITVKGRIDRIDTFEGLNNDCVIVDYKSSKTASVQKLVASRTRLQGPLYALAVRENRNLNPVAMLYWAVREDERYGWGKIPGTDLSFQPMPENWTTDAKARTIERLSGFLGGEVHAHPEEVDQCRWCDFNAACRVETLVEIEKARGA